MKGYLRADGRKGVRNVALVVYLVECAHFVAREIALAFRGEDVQVIGFSGCYPNDYAYDILERLCTHANVGAVLLVSLGCEGFDRRGLAEAVRRSGRPTETAVIQAAGGTAAAVTKGTAWIDSILPTLKAAPKVPMAMSDLVVGTICGGSDGTSGLTANPAIGRAFDRLVATGARCIFGENAELIGCEQFMAARATTPDVAEAVLRAAAKAVRYDHALAHGSFAPGNADGGLTTQEEKSVGAYAKSGSAPIVGVLQPGNLPIDPGLYLMDDTPDGEPQFGYAQMNDSTKLAELAASGAHVILYSTGRGSVLGSAIAPTIKVCANPATYKRMAGDMDIDAGRILEGRGDLETVGREIFDLVLLAADGERTKPEALGHAEFVLSYKTYQPAGPACLPGAA
jgi:altronate hydrolase